MLQSMRENLKGTVAIIIVGFLGLIMALSLVDFGAGASRQSGEVATVNGNTIGERELQLALAQEKQRLQSQFGNNLPADFLSDERLRAPVLQGLVQRSALLDVATDGNMTASDSYLDSLIIDMPQFQVAGKFDSEQFLLAIRRIGHTPASFRKLLRDDVIVNQLRSGLAATEFITDAELQQIIALSRQTRDFSWLTLPLGELPVQMVVSDEEIQAYYDANKQNYTTEEKVAIEFIELKVSDIANTLTVSDTEIQQQYQQEIQAFQVGTEREAAHIMIEGDDAEAKQKITDVQEKLSAGSDFAVLAAEYSDDFGSKENGGNLGISTGDAFPDAFEAALAQLSLNQVSAPVAIDGATHFIKLIAVKEKTPPTFAESKERIATEVKSLQAEEIFIEKLTALKDLAYNADNLTAVAEQLSLAVGKTQLFTRSGGSEPVLSDSRIVTAAFSDQVLQQGYTSDVLELAPDHAIVMNMIQHEPVRTLSLDEKKEAIIADLKLTKAKAALAEEANALEAALASGKSLTSLAEEKGLSVNSELAVTRDVRTIDARLVEHVFSLSRPVDDKDAISSVVLENNDYAVLVLSAVHDGNVDTLSAEELRNARLSLARSYSVDAFRAWQSLLVSEAKVKIIGSTN